MNKTETQLHITENNTKLTANMRKLFIVGVMKNKFSSPDDRQISSNLTDKWSFIHVMIGFQTECLLSSISTCGRQNLSRLDLRILKPSFRPQLFPFFIIFFFLFLLPCQPLHQRLTHVNGLKLPKSHWFNAPKLILNSMPVFQTLVKVLSHIRFTTAQYKLNS